MSTLPGDLQVHRDFATYFLASGSNTEDVQVAQHRNGLCVISLASSHPVLDTHRRISKVDFNIGHDRDRNQLNVSGKKKKGSVQMHPGTGICRVVCSDGAEYTIRAAVGGKLIEVNMRLLQNPMLLHSSSREGFLGVIQPPSVFGDEDDSSKRELPNSSLLVRSAYANLRQDSRHGTKRPRVDGDVCSLGAAAN